MVFGPLSYFFSLEATAEKHTGKLFIVAKFQKGKTDLFCDVNYFRVIIIVKCQHPLPELLLSVHNGFCFLSKFIWYLKLNVLTFSVIPLRAP